MFTKRFTKFKELCDDTQLRRTPNMPSKTFGRHKLKDDKSNMLPKNSERQNKTTVQLYACYTAYR